MNSNQTNNGTTTTTTNSQYKSVFNFQKQNPSPYLHPSDIYRQSDKSKCYFPSKTKDEETPITSEYNSEEVNKTSTEEEESSNNFTSESKTESAYEFSAFEKNMTSEDVYSNFKKSKGSKITTA